MKKLLFVLVIAAGFWHWKTGRVGTIPSVDSAGNPVVVAFTFSQCGSPCDDIIASLKRRGVPFNEIVVDHYDPGSDQYKLWQKYGTQQFPLVVAGKEKFVGSGQSELVGLLAANYRDKYLTASEAKYYQRHFDASGKPQVVLYGTDWCPSCAALRKEMREDGTSFVDIDVEKSEDYRDMVQTMEIPGYPAVWVGYRRVRGHTLAAVKDAM